MNFNYTSGDNEHSFRWIMLKKKANVSDQHEFTQGLIKGVILLR